MVRVSTFEKKYQHAVIILIKEIAEEFEQSIFSPSTHGKVLDQYWIATIADEVIGTIGVMRGCGNYAILKKMFVKKEFRGEEKGASLLLLQTAIDWCAKERITSMFLGTMTQFRAAQKFYEKNGFHKIDKATLPIDFPQNPIDDVFYKKNLPTTEFIQC